MTTSPSVLRRLTSWCAPLFVCLATELTSPQPRAQNPCGEPHLVGLPHPAGITGAQLLDVAAVGMNDVWAVGFTTRNIAGQQNAFPWILHQDGTRFQSVPAPSVAVPGGRTYVELHAVGGSGPNDIWAAGLYERQHPLSGAVGQQVFLLHWDGMAWSQVPAPVTNPGATGAWIDEVQAFASNDGECRVDQVPHTRTRCQHTRDTSPSVGGDAEPTPATAQSAPAAPSPHASNHRQG